MDHTYCFMQAKDPTINCVNKKQKKTTENGLTLQNKLQIETTNLKKFRCNYSRKSNGTPRKSNDSQPDSVILIEDVGANVELSDELSIITDIATIKIEVIEERCRDEQTQTEISLFNGNPLKGFRVMTDAQLEYHIGFHVSTFNLIYSTLIIHHPRAFTTVTSLTPHDQLLLTLYKYRHNTESAMLATEFDTRLGEVVGVIAAVTTQLYEVLNAIDFWQYARNYSETNRVCSIAVVDVMEVNVGCSKTPIQGYKVLLAASECGCFSFCSKLHDIKISDEELIAQCEFAKLINRGDRLVKGKNLCIKQSANVSKAFVNHLAVDTRRKKLIIEKLIASVKTNKIVSDSMDSELTSQILYNCVMLCNFKPSVLNST